MDFKVAGTEQVITALQLDTKLGRHPRLGPGRGAEAGPGARLTILEVMRGAITEPGEMSAYAPRIITIKVPVDKIGEVIGPKGKMINSIQDDTGRDHHRGRRHHLRRATDGSSAEAARAAINAIANRNMPGSASVPRHGGEDDHVRRVSSRSCPARTACCTSPRSASCTAAGGSRTSTKWCTSATRSRSRSARSTTAASCRWCRRGGGGARRRVRTCPAAESRGGDRGDRPPRVQGPR